MKEKIDQAISATCGHTIFYQAEAFWLTGKVKPTQDVTSSLPGWSSQYQEHINISNPNHFQSEVKKSTWYQVLIQGKASHTPTLV